MDTRQIYIDANTIISSNGKDDDKIQNLSLLFKDKTDVFYSYINEVINNNKNLLVTISDNVLAYLISHQEIDRLYEVIGDQTRLIPFLSVLLKSDKTNAMSALMGRLNESDKVVLSEVFFLNNEQKSLLDTEFLNANKLDFNSLKMANIFMSHCPDIDPTYFRRYFSSMLEQPISSADKLLTALNNNEKPNSKLLDDYNEIVNKLKFVNDFFQDKKNFIFDKNNRNFNFINFKLFAVIAAQLNMKNLNEIFFNENFKLLEPMLLYQGIKNAVISEDKLKIIDTNTWGEIARAAVAARDKQTLLIMATIHPRLPSDIYYSVKQDKQDDFAKFVRETFEQPYKANKSSLIAKGSFFNKPINKPISIVDAVLSQTYSDSQTQKENFQIKLAQFATAPLTKPFMAFLGLAALGKNQNTNKHFKVIISEKGTQHFSPEETSGSYVEPGLYRFKNSVFIAASETMVQHFMHESTHFVMQKIYQNLCNPYSSSDIEAKKLADQVVKDIITRISSDEFNKMDQKYGSVAASFKIVTEAYKPSQFATEFIVKVNETIGILGLEEGEKWLKKYMPELLEFYKNTINAAIEKYLETHQAKLFLTNESIEVQPTLSVSKP